jgi:rhamnulose-1-phosphate aldolase/alcohol dehydrogenase
MKLLKDLWTDPGTTDDLELLQYRSNLLGADLRITNFGGGNTSSKYRLTDPFTGKPVMVMAVKGSGGDLGSIKKQGFAILYMDRLEQLKSIYRGEQFEDEMVGFYPSCAFGNNTVPSSIDTPLHAFIPANHVDHTHPNAVIAIAATKRSRELTREVFGEEIGWVPWMRPGFELGLLMQEEARRSPKLVGLVMAQHGLINWADEGKACYERTLSLIEKAGRFIESRDKGQKTFGGQKFEALGEQEREAALVALLPWLRGQVSQKSRFIGTVQTDAAVLRFVNSHDAPRLAELGTSCPDHFLRTKIKPLYVPWDPQGEDLAALKRKLGEGLEQYRRDYAAYYEKHKRPDSPAMRDPNPTVILIPGIGMVAWGKNKSESRVTAEFYNCAIEVMRGAEAIDEYIALPLQEAFDIEYWSLEEAKLKRMPPEKELARRVVVVVGAGSGIGKAVAQRVAKEGAHVVSADLNDVPAQTTADELTAIYGQGIGVAGSGISGCGPAVGAEVDITRRVSLRDLWKRAILAYGGIDHLVVTAGVFIAPGRDGNVTDEQWAKTFEVNVRGSYNAVDEARPIFEAQALPGCSVVLTTSVNATVAKKGSIAYDASKAAANHVVRELAIELAPLVRVNAIAPATVVEGSTMFPRDRVIASLAKYEIAFDESEDTEALRSKLAEFYAQRTLTRQPITPADQAEAAWFLLSSASSKTTGQVINVDGGLHEAFLR